MRRLDWFATVMLGAALFAARGGRSRGSSRTGRRNRRRLQRGELPLSSATHRGRWLACVVWVGALVAASAKAEAFDLSGGVGVGGLLVGAKPRLAVSPHAAITWSTKSGFLFAAHETASILPALNEHGPGIYNQLSAVLGYGWKDVNLNVGPALSIYSMPACNATICRHVTGFSVGGHAQLEVYFAGPLGVSASVNVDWIGGSSIVLPGGVAATALAGPVLRWSGR